jgi:hypothetical protein
MELKSKYNDKTVDLEITFRKLIQWTSARRQGRGEIKNNERKISEGRQNDKTVMEYTNRKTIINFHFLYQLLRLGSIKWTDNAQKMKIMLIIPYSLVIRDAA